MIRFLQSKERRLGADLVLLWMIMTFGFFVLGVPARHSFWFSINILAHSAIGTTFLGPLSRCAKPTIVFFCGPGLVVGGALSVFIFQILGRGLLASVILGLIGAVALLTLAVDLQPETETSKTPVRLMLLCGLTPLLMSSQFTWLIPLAICLWMITTRLSLSTNVNVSEAAMWAALCTTVLTVILRLRGATWWIITDDYQLFDVIARHITRRGLLADWGSLDISRYHWLSYAWSGLLDASSGSPSQLITLTRVMPVVYSLALSASIVSVVETLALNERLDSFRLLLVWAVVAGIRVDWSAPSTAGAFAVIASLLAMLTMTYRGEPSWIQRTLIYVVFSCVLSLTKLPSALVLPSLVLSNEYLIRSRLRSHTTRIVGASIYALLGGGLSVLLLIPFESVLGYVNLAWVTGGSGNLRTLVADIFVAMVRNAWIIAPTGAVMSFVLRNDSTPSTPSTPSTQGAQALFASLFVLHPVGAFMNSVVLGTNKANLHEYFSAPNYFLSGLVLLSLASVGRADIEQKTERRQLAMWTLFAVVSALFGTLARCALESFSALPLTIQEVLTDSRVIYGSTFSLLSISRFSTARSFRAPMTLLFIVAVLGGISGAMNEFIDNPKKVLTPLEIQESLGTPDEMAVGQWLDHNSRPEDWVATNSLSDKTGTDEFGDDFALAMWARREFLVLGPKFFDQVRNAKAEIELSERFASRPNQADARTLLELGVHWFVVDLDVTSNRKWEPYGEVRFRTQSLWVIQIRSFSERFQ